MEVRRGRIVKVFRVLGVILVVLLVLGWAGSSYMLSAEPIPETSSYELDLDQIRQVAQAEGGLAPLRINEELIAEAELPRVAVFGGESFDGHPMVHRSFQIVWEDRSVIIDAAMGEAMVETMGGGAFHQDAYDRMQQGMARAESIVFTHEHQDHIDGVAEGDPKALAGRVLFNAAQIENSGALALVEMPGATIEAARTFVGGRYVAIAPGVVLIEAAGHTPGSQMVYVALRDGREFLFLGDVAWHMRQIEELIYRPRFVTDWILGEDREKVMGQFRTLHNLHREGKIRFVVSHDVDQRKALLADGLIGTKFEL